MTGTLSDLIYTRPALATTQFRGEQCNFYGLLKHMQSTDRALRKEAFLAWAHLYDSISGRLDAIYDEMVHLRHDMAQIGAFQFYATMKTDRAKAWEDYCRLCRAGGSVGYFKLLELAGLDNPFLPGTVEKAVAGVLEELGV